MNNNSEKVELLGKIGINENGEATIREPIFITINEFKKNKFLDIRKYYREGNEWKPSKKGITISLEQFSDLLNFLVVNEKNIKEKLNS